MLLSPERIRIRSPLALIAILPFCLVAADEDSFRAARERMVGEQIEARGVSNTAVLRVMKQVPRHSFVPDAVRWFAYDDGALPIGYRATISQPYIVALMTELLEPGPQHSVLEIGTGSGYQAAVLSCLVRQVYSIELVPELAKAASERLAAMGYENVIVRAGDGYKGWPDKAPFDRIILTAAPSAIPEALISQLKPGGKLVAPVGTSPYNQVLVVVDKALDSKTRQRTVTSVAFVPMVPGK